MRVTHQRDGVHDTGVTHSMHFGITRNVPTAQQPTSALHLKLLLISGEHTAYTMPTFSRAC